MRPMSEKEILAAALSDPDAKPFSGAQIARMKHTPRAKLIRRVLGLTQEEFAARFRIPSAPCAIGSRAQASRTRPREPI
jgi:putative transcriptional regulator